MDSALSAKELQKPVENKKDNHKFIKQLAPLMLLPRHIQ
jgi:hypothetical protein